MRYTTWLGRRFFSLCKTCPRSFKVGCLRKSGLADIAVFQAENANVRQAGLAGGLRVGSGRQIAKRAGGDLAVAIWQSGPPGAPGPPSASAGGLAGGS